MLTTEQICRLYSSDFLRVEIVVPITMPPCRQCQDETGRPQPHHIFAELCSGSVWHRLFEFALGLPLRHLPAKTNFLLQTVRLAISLQLFDLSRERVTNLPEKFLCRLPRIEHCEAQDEATMPVWPDFFEFRLHLAQMKHPCVA